MNRPPTAELRTETDMPGPRGLAGVLLYDLYTLRAVGNLPWFGVTVGGLPDLVRAMVKLAALVAGLSAAEFSPLERAARVLSNPPEDA